MFLTHNIVEITGTMNNQKIGINPEISIDWEGMYVIAEFNFESLQKFHEFEKIIQSVEFKKKIQELLDEYLHDSTDLIENTMLSEPCWESDEIRAKKRDFILLSHN